MADSFFTITLGELMSFGAVLAGVAGAIFGFGRKFQSIEQASADTRSDLMEMKTELGKLSSVLTQMAVASTRMDMFDKRLDDIVSGRIRIFRNSSTG